MLNLPPSQLLEIIDEDAVDPEVREVWRAIRPTAGVVIDYGLKRPISFDTGLWYLWEPMAFGTFTSNLCPELAPSGKQLLTFLMPVEPDELVLVFKRELEHVCRGQRMNQLHKALAEITPAEQPGRWCSASR